MRINLKLTDGSVTRVLGETISIGYMWAMWGGEYYLVSEMSGLVIAGPFSTKSPLLRVCRAAKLAKLPIGFCTSEAMWKAAGGYHEFHKTLRKIQNV